MRFAPGCERGSALATSLVFVTLMVGTTGAFIAMTAFRSQEQSAHYEKERARRAVDGSVSVKMVQLARDAEATGLVVGRTPEGIVYAVKAEKDTRTREPVVKIAAYGESGVSAHKVIVYAQQDTEPMEGEFRAGVVSNEEIRLNGNITIDGRDYNYSGTARTGNSGVFGVSTRQSLTIGGAASVGGNGVAPQRAESNLTREENAAWGNNTDTNGNGVIDPSERRFPASEDEVFNLPAGTLKATAMRTGTYFRSSAEWLTYLSLHPTRLPGGVVFYLDFVDSNLNIDFPEEFNDPPSIFVNHKRDPAKTDPNDPAGIARLNNIHGKFRGVMVVDGIKHFNGGFTIVGGIVSLADQEYGNVFGNGNANILFSHAVMGNLPRVAQEGNPWRVLSWTEEEGASLSDPLMRDCYDAVQAKKREAATVSVSTNASVTTK